MANMSRAFMNIIMFIRLAEGSATSEHRYRDWYTQGRQVIQKTSMGNQDVASTVRGPAG